MSILLVILFVLGMGVALLVRGHYPTPPPKPRRPTKKDHLDDVDHMFLYGEVTHDPFYDW